MPAPLSPVRLGRMSAGVVLGLGALAVVGWAFERPCLRGAVAGAVPMNPVTALAFVATGLAIFAALRRGRAPAIVRGGLGAAILAVAALRLGAEVGVSGAPLLDEVLFAAQLAGNRMAPNTAAGFLLVGGALVLLDRRVGRFHPSTFLLVGAALVAWLALIGYAYDVLSFYRMTRRVPMALPTAIAFVVATFGLICARPERDPVLTFESDSAGGALVRRLVPFGVVVPAAIGWLRIEGQRRDLFSNETGVTIFVATTSALFLLVVWWCGRVLRAVDAERARAHEQLRELAMNDPLTGLRNRRSLAAAALDGRAAVLFFIDLDGLKKINDELGHELGDAAIRAFGRVLLGTFRSSDVLARLGGDEFAVLAVGSSDEGSPELARIDAELARFNARRERQFDLAASIGTCKADPAMAPDIEELLARADAAMYADKRSKRTSRALAA